jgi:hypothetical protein
MIGYVVLFAVVYPVLLMVAGWIKTRLALSSGMDAAALIGAAIGVSSRFIYRHRRYLRKAEVVKLSLGAFMVDAVAQLGTCFFLIDGLDWLFSWFTWFVLALHLIGLFFVFGNLSRAIAKPIVEAERAKSAG